MAHHKYHDSLRKEEREFRFSPIMSRGLSSTGSPSSRRHLGRLMSPRSSRILRKREINKRGGALQTCRSLFQRYCAWGTIIDSGNAARAWDTLSCAMSRMIPAMYFHPSAAPVWTRYGRVRLHLQHPSHKATLSHRARPRSLPQH